MRGWLTILVVLAGCGFRPAGVTATDPDGGNNGRACFGGGLLAACLDTPPADDLTLDALAQIDTDTDPRCIDMSQTAGSNVCVIAAHDIEIGGNIIAIGSLPLVLLATDTLTLSPSGTLDVSSIRGMRSGAGASSAACVAAMPAATNPGGGGGGAGGSFGDFGGNGALGNYAVGRALDQEAPGGIAGPTPSLAIVQGGCAGEIGADGATANIGGAGGDGGGGLYLIAGTQVVVAGVLAAGGAGGTGGGNQAGGGGGGAGGLVGVDAPAIAISGMVSANGGGGGQGGASNGNGYNGMDAFASTTVVASGGYNNQTLGGAGGNGGLASSTIGDTGAATDSGAGAGGGSVGIIYLRGTVTNSGQLSPAPTFVTR